MGINTIVNIRNLIHCDVVRKMVAKSILKKFKHHSTNYLPHNIFTIYTMYRLNKKMVLSQIIYTFYQKISGKTHYCTPGITPEEESNERVGESHNIFTTCQLHYFKRF